MLMEGPHLQVAGDSHMWQELRLEVLQRETRTPAQLGYMWPAVAVHCLWGHKHRLQLQGSPLQKQQPEDNHRGYEVLLDLLDLLEEHHWVGLVERGLMEELALVLEVS